LYMVIGRFPWRVIALSVLCIACAEGFFVAPLLRTPPASSAGGRCRPVGDMHCSMVHPLRERHHAMLAHGESTHARARAHTYTHTHGTAGAAGRVVAQAGTEWEPEDEWTPASVPKPAAVTEVALPKPAYHCPSHADCSGIPLTLMGGILRALPLPLPLPLPLSLSLSLSVRQAVATRVSDLKEGLLRRCAVCDRGQCPRV
jgi:hypothetical protein